MLRYILILVSLLVIFHCGSPAIQTEREGETPLSSQTDNLSMNLDHLNHLYTEKQFRGKTIGVIHIYSEYPDYTYTIEPKEGFACVDDVSRAVILISEIEGASKKLGYMTEFLLQMQNENGYFNNFLWGDMSINSSYKTSEAKPDWWSWRALWALETVYPIFQKNDSALSVRIDQATNKLIENILRLESPIEKSKSVEGIIVPTTLPYGSAADQASVMLLGLLPFWERSGNEEVKEKIIDLANRILEMQLGEESHFPYGMFLSWENLWHAYGNIQSYALLKAGKLLNESKYIKAALTEVDHFYPWLLEHGFAEYFRFKKEGSQYSMIEDKSYPQIAYGIRPIVWACCEAYKITGEVKYKNLALEYIKWLSGSNVAQTAMYDPSTGRCFDGIISPEEINKNSGAESTIEALLSIQAFLRITND